MAFERVIVRALLAAAGLLVTPRAFAEDAPVEKPAVDRPALPQPAPDNPSKPSRAAGPREAPPRTRQAGGSGALADGRQRNFVYFAFGPGVLVGLSGGPDFERSNAAITGAFGIEIPLSQVTGLGFELNGDLEFAGQTDRGTYTAMLLRARLGRMLTPHNRLWGALGLGGAGYQTGSLAFEFAAGTSWMLAPKFGLDFSANLNLLGASSSNNAGVRNEYDGGAVLLLAIRALFELHR